MTENQETALEVAADLPLARADQLKSQIDAFLEVREYLRKRISELLIPEVDYFETERFDKKKGHKVFIKSLAKPGAEKLAAVMQYRAAFLVDKDTMALFTNREGWVAYVCTLTDKHAEFIAEGRGADWLSRNQDDPNKTIKMAQKRAYIDAVIRATGLSDIFTQDMEPEDQADSEGHVIRVEATRESNVALPSTPAQLPKRRGRPPKSLAAKINAQFEDMPKNPAIPDAVEEEIGKLLQDKCITEVEREATIKWLAKEDHQDPKSRMKGMQFLRQVLADKQCRCDIPF